MCKIYHFIAHLLNIWNYILFIRYEYKKLNKKLSIYHQKMFIVFFLWS